MRHYRKTPLLGQQRDRAEHDTYASQLPVYRQPAMGPGGNHDTSDDGSSILRIRVTMRSDELLSIDSDNELSECTTSDWTGYTLGISPKYILSFARAGAGGPCSVTCAFAGAYRRIP